MPMLENFTQYSELNIIDPSQLKVEVKNTTVGLLVEMLDSDVIDMHPYFQRKEDLWSKKKKSELIESILLGLPVPSFYFYLDTRRKKWVIIDGLQRLCSIRDFMVKESMKLEGLEILKDLNQRTYNTFSFFEQTNMKMFPVTLNVISGDVNSFIISQIFKRVNSAGTPLNAAEIRNALYQGPATILIDKMVALPVFQRLVSRKVNVKRMLDKDYANRYLAFRIGDFNTYKGNLELFLSDALKFVNSLPEENTKYLLADFENALTCCERLHGEDVFRLPKKDDSMKTGRISRSLFEMLTLSFAGVSLTSLESICQHRQEYLKCYHNLLKEPKIEKSLISSTSTRDNVETRLNGLKSIINKFL